MKITGKNIFGYNFYYEVKYLHTIAAENTESVKLVHHLFVR